MSLRLIDLDPEFVRYEDRDGRIYYVIVPTIGEAQGLRFLCPKCFAANGGPVGTHSVICWSRSRGVPDDADPRPGRWMLNGAGNELVVELPQGQREALRLIFRNDRVGVFDERAAAIAEFPIDEGFARHVRSFALKRRRSYGVGHASA